MQVLFKSKDETRADLQTWCILVQDRGLIPRVFQELFSQIQSKQVSQVCYCLTKYNMLLSMQYSLL